MWSLLNSRFGLHRLRSQLILTFLAGFLGIGIAIGLPMLVLINRQATSQAQLLLDQSVVASRAFIESQESNLDSLALLVSQRPTLMRLLEEQSFSALGDYLKTLQEGANLDLILICSNGNDVTAFQENISIAELCPEESPTGYAISGTSSEQYLYSSVSTETLQGASYKIIVGRKTS